MDGRSWKVLASDPETAEQDTKPVTEVFAHDDTLVDLHLGNTTIRTTEDHPFWSVTDQQFERADDLTPGELVLTATGDTLTVTGLTPAGTGTAYNLAIADIHTYHVGDNAVLVHNSCGVDDGINWSARSGSTFGHTFTRHGMGAKITRSLLDRARGGSQQGQWLDNDAAADLLRRLYVPGAGPRVARIPQGLGQVVMPDGSILPAGGALMVPKPGGILYETAYPILRPG